MFIEQFYDDGLAHLSYLIGDEQKAIVIDPHLDVDDYLDFAHKKNVRIIHIFETHRNEDYVIGSRALSAMTGADIFHGKNLHFQYGHPVKEDDLFKMNQMEIRVLETPGHTGESISLVLYDKSSSDAPFAVFTGDALFVGSVGRTDLWKTRTEAAGELYDSILKKILPLGDHVLLYPAHGAGSVCGDGIGARNFSTLGYEKKYNKSLQVKNKQAFIDAQKDRQFEIPPYFKEMEKRNQNGPDVFKTLPKLAPVSISDLKDKKAQIIDIRSPEAYAGVAIPDSISIPAQMISKFAGWFIDYNKDIILIAENEHMMGDAVRQLVRLGYKKFLGWFPGLHAWEITGKSYWHTPAIHAMEVKERIKQDKPFTLLDVRSDNEWKSGHLPGAKHVYIGELLDHLKEMNKDTTITTFCGSGQRATIAASLLKKHQFENIEICFGSMAACKEVGCPIEKS